MNKKENKNPVNQEKSSDVIPLTDEQTEQVTGGITKGACITKGSSIIKGKNIDAMIKNNVPLVNGGIPGDDNGLVDL